MTYTVETIGGRYQVASQSGRVVLYTEDRGLALTVAAALTADAKGGR